MPHFAVLAIGRDKKGIVAKVTGALYRLGCTIETSQMAILGDQFSMMLVVSSDQAHETEIKQRLDDAIQDEAEHGETWKYEVAVTPIQKYASGPSVEASHLMTTYCEERSGVISAISQALCDQNANITHLHSRVQAVNEKNYCVVRAYITLPQGVDQDTIRASSEKALSDDDSLAVTIEQLAGDPQNRE